jgi:RimJ/RimL family protein N-acetyltransferase
MGTEGPRYTLEEQRAFLVSAQNDPGSLYLIAFRDEQVVGLLSFSAGKRKRIRHAGEFTLAIMQDWGGMGIGKAMMHRLVNWAQVNGIHKINLEVRTENKRAIELYLACGFSIEGLITRTVFYNGGYHDSYAMGLIVEQQETQV